MHFKFFTPIWGYQDKDIHEVCARAADAGYDGIEMSLLLDEHEREAAFAALDKYGLDRLAQHWETVSLDFEEHRDQFRANLERIAQDKPKLLNSHTGKDFFTFEQNLQLLDDAAEVSAATGMKIVHETHRGRFAYAGAITKAFLDARPDLRLTADFSHWCCVSESLLQGQEEFVEAAIQRTDHLHSRVGHEQGPQITDPRAPEAQETVEVFLGWWDRIVEGHRAKGSKELTITAEFGPWPYLPVLPFTQQPIANQWDINVYMMNMLRERYR